LHLVGYLHPFTKMMHGHTNIKFKNISLNLDGEKSNLFENQPRALSTNNKTLRKQNANILTH